MINNVTSYPGRNFSLVSGFTFTCTSDHQGYLVIDYYPHTFSLIKYDQHWNNKSINSFYFVSNPPQFIISINVSNSNEFFVTFEFGVYKFNSNLSIVAYYHGRHNYKGIYYNKTGDYIVTCSNVPAIEILARHDLKYIRHISTTPYTPTDIHEFNGILFVGTTVGIILELNNEIITSHFNTTCGTSILSLEIDPYGQIAILCNLFIYLYSINGTYLNVSWSSPILNPTSIGFDNYGNFILTSKTGIYVFS